jgi:hypothetical protein
VLTHSGPCCIAYFRARFNFLDPRAKDFWGDWDRAADDTVALLRAQAGRDPYNKALTDLIGELWTRSEDFRTRWAAHNVRQHRTGIKHFHHALVGDLHLTFETMQLSADDGLTLLAYGTQPGTASEDGLRLLASWSATSDQDADADATNPSPMNSRGVNRRAEVKALVHCLVKLDRSQTPQPPCGHG